MIHQQRRRWQSQESDLAIARRAERAYSGLSKMFAIVALIFVALARNHPPFVMGAVGFVVGSAILFWQSKQFAEVQKILAESDQETDSH